MDGWVDYIGEKKEGRQKKEQERMRAWENKIGDKDLKREFKRKGLINTEQQILSGEVPAVPVSQSVLRFDRGAWKEGGAVDERVERVGRKKPCLEKKTVLPCKEFFLQRPMIDF